MELNVASVNAARIARSGQARDRLAVRRFEERDVKRWEEFVVRCPDTTFFHRIGWRQIFEDVFHHRTHYLLAERGSEISGVLPLAEIKSRLFGHALISSPFCVYAGPVALDAETERALIET